MKTIWRFVVTFLVLLGAVAVASVVFGVRFERAEFWDHHGLIFLACIAFFPRLTLLLADVPTGGLLWWLGLIFAPRVLVAVLATLVYWYRNPGLVVIAWLVALGGESSEKYVIARRSGYKPTRKGYDQAKWVDTE